MAAKLYQVHLNQITAGVEVTDGIVTEAAPVLRKFVGARLAKLRTWLMAKGGSIRPVREEAS
jgi:hypothetical protein